MYRTSGNHLRRRWLAFSVSAVLLAPAAGCQDGARPSEPSRAAQPGAPAGSASRDPGAPAIHVESHRHGAHADNAVVLPPVPATPWPSDAPLRDGMRRMHRVLDVLGHGEHGHLDRAQVTAAAQQVRAAAEEMFANCRLEPEPDAALHGVLAVLLQGAGALEANPGDLAPLAGMRSALAHYPRLFVDPQWEADTQPSG